VRRRKSEKISIVDLVSVETCLGLARGQFRRPLSVTLIGLFSSLLMMAAGVSAASEVPLIWEQEVFNVDQYAKSLFDEADRFFGSPTSAWDLVGKYDRGLQVFSRPVQGSKVLQLSIHQQLTCTNGLPCRCMAIL
jgi:hypothetical protein